MENTITILFEKKQTNPYPFLSETVRNICNDISHAWQIAVGTKKLLVSNVFSIHIITIPPTVDICLFVNLQICTVTTVKMFDLASLWTLEQLPQDVPRLRIDFTFSCLAELWGMRKTSTAFVHVAALLQVERIKQKKPPLPPSSQDVKGFAADVVCICI